MVITCPSCSARYRLNPDKIQGRGAKITCPKCSHVFVVFTEQEAAQADASGDQPRVKTPPRPSAPAAPTGDKRVDTQSGAFAALGMNPAESSRSPGSKRRVVAPGPRSTRRLRALSKPGAAVPQAPGGGLPAADAEITSASSLDFRAVGIKTWKVKVAIGLIYDFSDISTLQKYLDDKKVTPDDLISHNNQDWTRIGDIPDLETHFIDIWKEARAGMSEGDAEAADKPKTNPEAEAPIGTSTDSFRIDRTGGASQKNPTTGRTTGNYAVPAPPAPPTSVAVPTAEEEEAHNRRMIWVLVALVVLGLPAAYFLWPEEVTVPVAEETPPPVPIEELGPDEEELKRIQDEIRRKIDERAEELAGDPVDEEPLPEEAEADRERRLVPVPPSERKTPVQRPPVVANTPEPTPRPKYQAPLRKPEATPAPAPTPAPEPAKTASSGGGTVKEKKGDPARMYLTAGQKKLADGDFGSAKKMFEAAIKKDANCGACYAGLAEAEKQLGNAQAASAAQKKADSLGNTQSMARP